MDATKDYYAVLGVLPSIEQAALAAVYRALLKKYHPDVYSGPKADAERITKELNEAFGVLGSIEKRNAYDNARKSQHSSSGDYGRQQEWDTTEDTDIEAEVNRNWAYVVRYRPNLEGSRRGLESLSPSLAFAFQVTVLETKSWGDANEVAEGLERQFLETYFGTDFAIHKFVLKALGEGRRDVALEVNQAIKVLGTPTADHVTEFLNMVRRTTSWHERFSHMGYCPGCKKLRGPHVHRCLYCGNSQPTAPER